MSGTVLRRGYVPVEPDVTGFDNKLRDVFRKQDPGGKAGKQLGGQLNRALKRLDLDAIDVRADPAQALAAMAVTEARLRELSRTAATVEVKVQTERSLGELARFRKQLGNVGVDAGPEAALGFAAKFSQRLGPLVANPPISGPVAAAVVSAGAAAAPLLAAALSAGVIAGVSTGVIASGISVAAKDARVQSAAKELGTMLQTRLENAATSFIDPAIQGLGRIRLAADTVDFEGIFADASRYVPTLTDGASRAITALGSGVAALVREAGPVVGAISDGIATIGKTLGDGLRQMAENGPAAGAALRDVFAVINGSLKTVFSLVNALTEIYELNKKIGGDQVFQAWMKMASAAIDGTGQAARRTQAGTFGMAGQFQKAADKAAELKRQQDLLKPVQDALRASQDGLSSTLDSLGVKSSFAARNADALRTAMTNLYGATMTQTDANEAYEASWDSLSGAVKANGRSLNIHTEAGRGNRDALQGLLTTTRDSYVADIAAGTAITAATKKHRNRIDAIREESRKLGLNKTETQKLIDTYGAIPAKKTTDLVLDGVRTVVQKMYDLYILQRSLATGKSIASVEQTIRKGSDSGPAKRNGGYRQGGRTLDVPEDQAAGVVHGREFVFDAPTVRRIDRQQPGFLDEVHATGALPGYRAGGRVAPVDTSRRWPFSIDGSGTKVPSRAQAIAAVTPAFTPGAWPSSPSAQRGDSGVWKQVLQLIKSGPKSGSFGNAYRPGDPKWHGSGRAVDWMGFNQDALASFLAAKRPLELIHRTRNRDYAYTRGRNKGSFNNSLMEAHRNHIHIAMDDGGFRMLQPGMNLIPNGTGKQELIGGPKALASVAGGDIHFHRGAFDGAIMTNSRQAEDLVVAAVQSAKRKRRLP